MHLRLRIGSALTMVAGVVLVASVGSSCNLDPVHRAEVNNLGPENGDLYPTESEFHRPGEPCAVCHSNAGPSDDHPFVLAGTIFWGPDRYDRRVDQAYVRIGGPGRTKKCYVTNCNGNFFVKPEDYPNLKFPLLISVERVQNPTGQTADDQKPIAVRRMTGHIGREASCATCHILGLRDYGSPGQIHLFETEGEVDNLKPPIPPSCPNDLPRAVRCPEDRL